MRGRGLQPLCARCVDAAHQGVKQGQVLVASKCEALQPLSHTPCRCSHCTTSTISTLRVAQPKEPVLSSTLFLFVVLSWVIADKPIARI